MEGECYVPYYKILISLTTKKNKKSIHCSPYYNPAKWTVLAC